MAREGGESGGKSKGDIDKKNGGEEWRGKGRELAGEGVSRGKRAGEEDNSRRGNKTKGKGLRKEGERAE
jgi:hypothetical protein